MRLPIILTSTALTAAMGLTTLTPAKADGATSTRNINHRGRCAGRRRRDRKQRRAQESAGQHRTRLPSRRWRRVWRRPHRRTRRTDLLSQQQRAASRLQRTVLLDQQHRELRRFVWLQSERLRLRRRRLPGLRPAPPQRLNSDCTDAAALKPATPPAPASRRIPARSSCRSADWYSAA